MLIKGSSSKNKKFVQKKVASYDVKLVTIITVALVVVTLGIVGVVLGKSISDSNVAKVSGKSVKDYEFKQFLKDVKAEMEEDAQKDLKEDETFDAKTFWTDEKIKEAKDEAKNKVAEFQAEYLIAKDAGFEVTKTEKQNIQNNINAYMNYYYQMYTQYGMQPTYEELLSMMGIEDFDEYCKYLYKANTIEKYRDDMESKFKLDDLYDGDAKGEDAVTKKYNDNIDQYRRVELTTLAYALPTAPTAPKEVVEPTKPETEDENSEEYKAYEAACAEYEAYKKDLETYKEQCKTYDEEKAQLETKVQAMFDAFVKDGKYTGDGIVPEKDGTADASATEVAKYTDAALEDIAAKESALYADNKGVNSFSGKLDEASDVLTKYALSLDWVDWKESSTAIASSLENETQEITETVPEKKGDTANDIVSDNNNVAVDEEVKNDFTTTKLGEYKLIKDDAYIYITKCNNILDINTSREEAPAADDENTEATLSVRAMVINALKETKSEDDLKKLVKDAGAKYDLKKVKAKIIDKIAAEVFAK